MLSLIRKSLSFNQQVIFCFAKGSRPKAQAKELKLQGKGRAQSDEKSAKISQAEQEEQQKRAQDEIRRRQDQDVAKKSQPKMKTWDTFWEEHVDQAELLKLKMAKFPIYYQHIKQESKKEVQPSPQTTVLLNQETETIRRLGNKSPIPARDLSEQFNQKYQNDLAVVTYKNDSFVQPLRCGAIGTKVGMTATWDKWGKRHALTVIQLDRNQVVQVKTKEYDGVDSIQIGAGEANIKTLSKPSIGHYLKNDIPPKRVLCEYPISPENRLPIGFMITARHFIPGQIIDVCGQSVGKGWAGTIKKYNFTLQPKSHGNSLSHRSPGSQGNRADPGRVFKGKKMSGRLGNISKTIECLTIFKIDAERSLIFVKGSVPGKAGNVLYLRDAVKNAHKNDQLLNYPTFIPEKGQILAKQITMIPPEEDPEAREVHENDVIKGEEEE